MSVPTPEKEEDLTLDRLKGRLKQHYDYLYKVLNKAEAIESITRMQEPEAKAEAKEEKKVSLLQELHRSMHKIEQRTGVINTTLEHALSRLKRVKK